ncbi:MAG: hypothetical protein WCI63_01390 [bacterium]
MNKKTILLVICQIIVLLLLVHMIILKGYLTNATKLQALFVEAKTYTYTAEIIKTEIESRLPERIQNNIVEKAIVTKALDYFITPKLVQNLSKKPVERVVKSLNKKGNTEIVNDKVVIDTSKYKDLINARLNGWGLSKDLNTLAKDTVASIPAQISVVDLEKNPNSGIGYLVKARTYINQLGNLIVAMSILLAIFVAGVLYVNRKNLLIALRASGWVLGISGGLMVLLSYFGSPAISSTMAVINPTTAEMLFKNMVLAIGTNYVHAPGPLGAIFLIGGVVILIATSSRIINKIKHTTINKKASTKS